MQQLTVCRVSVDTGELPSVANVEKLQRTGGHLSTPSRKIYSVHRWAAPPSKSGSLRAGPRFITQLRDGARHGSMNPAWIQSFRRFHVGHAKSGSNSTRGARSPPMPASFRRTSGREPRPAGALYACRKLVQQPPRKSVIRTLLRRKHPASGTETAREPAVQHRCTGAIQAASRQPVVMIMLIVII